MPHSLNISQTNINFYFGKMRRIQRYSEGLVHDVIEIRLQWQGHQKHTNLRCTRHTPLKTTQSDGGLLLKYVSYYHCYHYYHYYYLIWGRAIQRYDQAYLDCTRKILESCSLKYQIPVADKLHIYTKSCYLNFLIFYSNVNPNLYFHSSQ